METLKAITKRRSTRNFNPEKQVSKADLENILAAANAAPVGMADYPSLHLTVIRNQEALAKINQAARTMMKVDRDILYGAPTLVLVCAADEQKAPNIQYANSACVVENMLLAATDADIDSVYLWGASTVVASNPELCKELEIPDGFKPVSAAALGYALEAPAEKQPAAIAVNCVE